MEELLDGLQQRNGDGREAPSVNATAPGNTRMKEYPDTRAVRVKCAKAEDGRLRHTHQVSTTDKWTLDDMRRSISRQEGLRVRIRCL